MQKLFTYLLFLAMLFWGLSWPLSKILSSDHSACFIAFGRFFIVGIMLIPILRYFRLNFTVKKENLPVLCANIFFNAAYSLVYFYALRLGNAGAAGVISTTLSPIIATFLSIIVFHNKLNTREMLGLAIGLISGIFLLNLSSIDSLFSPFNLFFILTAFLWACLSLCAKVLAKNLHPLVINFYSSFASSLLFIPFITLDDFLIYKELDSIAMLVIIALFSTIFGTTIYYKSIEILGITKSSSYTLLVPFFALILSWLILDEIPTIHTIIGGTLAIVAIYLISLYNKRHFIALNTMLRKIWT